MDISIVSRLIISLVLTLILEVGLALLLKIRGKSLWIVVLVNILTNPAVVYFSVLLGLSFLQRLIPELLAVGLEGGVYALFSTREGYVFRKPFLKSLLLNGFSYAIGILLSYIYIRMQQ